MPTYVYGAGNVTLNTGPLEFVIDFTNVGAPFGVEKKFKLAFYQQSQGDTISTLATYTPGAGPWGNDYSPLPGAYPTVRTITVPAGAVTVLFTWEGVVFIGVPNNYGTLTLTLQAKGEAVPPTYIASSTVVGNGTATPVSEAFSPGDVLVFSATPIAPDTFVNWSGPYTTSTSPEVIIASAPSENVTGIATFTSPSKYKIHGSHTSQVTTCKYAPPFPPYASILANGQIIPNGGYVEIDAGDSLMASVEGRPTPYTRVSSAKANGVEYAGVNSSSVIINFTPTGDVSITADVIADLVCQKGLGDPPTPPPDPPGGPGDPDDPEPPPPPPPPPSKPKSYGCTNPKALNYNPLAEIDNGSCVFLPKAKACKDPLASNYDDDPLKEEDNTLCVYNGDIDFEIYDRLTGKKTSVVRIVDRVAKVRLVALRSAEPITWEQSSVIMPWAGKDVSMEVTDPPTGELGLRIKLTAKHAVLGTTMTRTKWIHFYDASGKLIPRDVLTDRPLPYDKDNSVYYTYTGKAVNYMLVSQGAFPAEPNSDYFRSDYVEDSPTRKPGETWTDGEWTLTGFPTETYVTISPLVKDVLAFEGFTETITGKKIGGAALVRVYPRQLGWYPVDHATGVELEKDGTTYIAYAEQQVRFVAWGVLQDEARAWAFGDTTTSTDFTPIHVYVPAVETTYTATLTVGTDSVSHDIRVMPVALTPRGSDPTAAWPDLYRTGAEGLILRWRDDSGKWVHERKIDLNTRDPHVMLSRLGEYRIRQWELVMVDSVPQVVCYLEEEVEVVD